MFSFLKEIDKYLKENKIPLKRLEFSYTYLPSYINQAILYEIRRLSDKNFEFGCSTYELAYDNNGNLCLLIKVNKKQRIAITRNERNTSFNFKTVKRSEERLIKDACMLKYFNNYRVKIKSAIEENYGNYPKAEKIRCEYRLMYEFINQKFQKEPIFYHSIINKIDYETPLMDSVEKITSYIDFLYENSKLKKVELPKKKITQGISYHESEKAPVDRKSPIPTFCPIKERLNEIIATDLRFSVLESFPYIYRDYAYNIYNKEISYMAYMYHIDSNRYIIIMEPYNGIKYTKIVGIEDNSEMTKEKFDNYVKYYLELSKHKSIDDDKIVRISHTSFKQYERKIKYAIAYLSDGLCSNYYKTKIRKLREH